MAGIYRIKNIKTGKMYIGKTKGQFKTRWYSHRQQLNKGKSPCKYLQHTWTKYGESSFKFDVLVAGEFSKEELAKLELIFIKLYGHYNITNEAQAHDYSKTRVEKISKSLKEQWANGIRSKPKKLWDEYYIDVVNFWRNKNNGVGKRNHPGKTLVSRKFGFSEATAELMLQKIRNDKSIEIIEPVTGGASL